VAGIGKVERPKLTGAAEAQSELNNILDDFFENLAEGANPRDAIRLTMGTGKTKQTVAHLKTYLKDKYRQKIEVYVPRHDLADEWAEKLRRHQRQGHSRLPPHWREVG
jgi:superfamily II DNA or RNA helicase